MPNGESWPRITVVTPSYNQGPFLEETIRSVLLQGYPNLEYMIIDGGSTDQTIEIIHKYEAWLAYWVSEKDRGQSHAINKGWKRATGDILAWLNSDDFLLPAVLEQVALLYGVNKSAGFYHGQAQEVNKSGAVLKPAMGEEFDWMSSLETSVNIVCQPSTFVNRRALEAVGYVDEELQFSMDWDLWMRIGGEFPTVFKPAVWSAMRMWEGAKTSTIFARSGADHVTVAKKLFASTQNPALRKTRWRITANTYVRQAKLEYYAGNLFKFRKALLMSFVYYPFSFGGSARWLIPEFFLGKHVIHGLGSLRRGVRYCLGISAKPNPSAK
jgi:glycosyltransferase involved in cell wall biosynthesis